MSDTYTDSKSDEEDASPPYSDEELLGIVAEEMFRSIGFENDTTLRDKRLTALNYYKGEMTADIPSLPNRSKVVSSDVADAVETVLPDLMEIFTAAGDVAAFLPTKPEDEEPAQQETDYLNHVLFQDNPGFLIIYSGFKDALLLNTAIFEYGWKEEVDDEDFTGKTAQELLLATQSGQVINVQAEQGEGDQAEPTYSFTVRTDISKAEYWALPPDDFSVAPDTIRVQDSTYCCARYRPRVQDLIAEGYDADSVKELDPYTTGQSDEIQQAKDHAGEHLNSQTVLEDVGANLRQVEIRKHYLKLIDEDGDSEYWCMTTSATADKFIRKDGKAAWKVPRIPFAVGSPYLVAHRLYGISLAEQLFEIQKIKTSLMRALLDSSYFALNQRMEVAMDQANDYTISDLLRPEPGVPVRSRTGNATRPLNGPGLSFDAYKALEYFSTVGEMRTGIMRNAQGLNPDTLHDTAKGALMLMSAAQRRTRMIARILAETCLKELYLGLHAVIRENARSARTLKLNGKWLPIDPTKWGERNAMTIEVGLGAAGKDMDIAAMQHVIGLQKAGVELQGGAQGPVVKLDNLYQSAIDLTRKLGVKAVNKYFSDPSDPKNPPPPPQPNPEMAKVMGEMELEKLKAGNKMQAEMADLQAKKEIELSKAQSQATVTQHANELEHARKQAEQANNMEAERMKQEGVAELARIKAGHDEYLTKMKLEAENMFELKKALIQQETAIVVARISAKASMGQVEEGVAYSRDAEIDDPFKDKVLHAKLDELTGAIDKMSQTHIQGLTDISNANAQTSGAQTQALQTMVQAHAQGMTNLAQVHQQSAAALHKAIMAETEPVRDAKGKLIGARKKIT